MGRGVQSRACRKLLGVKDLVAPMWGLKVLQPFLCLVSLEERCEAERVSKLHHGMTAERAVLLLLGGS